ncbi:DUF4402 domain-containing protein [Porphyrobacter sp. AAP60]|uniref:DUF4402 domain-containing protein n=1 Tax=Porphyrobacter sp. AAP60 TaxID=1523423 RepID=UPI0006B90B78|nr:DUF4402 domain-containing protein [Porphyrobacter sp. AAP60]KPF63642.1 hypothetical protein IP79_07040 [Porphyrobacter sp. AAP60]
MCKPVGSHAIVAMCLAVSWLIATPAIAKPQEVRVRSQSELSFGTFMVFGSGSRSVSASGAVIDSAIVTLDGRQPRPARFTIEYDRGNESKHVLDVTIELVMSAPSSLLFGGVNARLSAFETDLPGHSRVASGEAMTIRLTGCRTRVCSRTFTVGGRLDISRNFGGARVDIPISIDARITGRDRL